MTIAKVWYGGNVYLLPRGEHQGSNLRAFFGVKRNWDLYFKSAEAADFIVEPKNVYFVEHDDRFVRVPKRKAGPGGEIA